MAHVENFVEAAKAYKQDVGSFPADLEALRSAPPHTPRWNGPYVQRSIPDDPWGHPYIYRFSSTPEVGSYGADGKPGGEGFDADVFAPVI
jgi:general secretion pathway protein G